MRSRRDLGRRRPGLARRTEAERVEPAAAPVDDDAECVTLARHQCGGRVDQGSDGRDAGSADDLPARDERPKPVGDVDELLTGQAGEEVLVPAGESHDLVRQDGADMTVTSLSVMSRLTRT